MLHERVRSDDGQGGRQLHILVREAPAVDLNGGVLAPEHGRVLVHDAAGHADELRSARCARRASSIGSMVRVRDVKQREGRRYLQCSGRTEPEPAGTSLAIQRSAGAMGTPALVNCCATPIT